MKESIVQYQDPTATRVTIETTASQALPFVLLLIEHNLNVFYGMVTACLSSSLTDSVGMHGVVSMPDLP